MKTVLLLVTLVSATLNANAATMKCKIEPSILSEFPISVPNAPAVMRGGQIGGAMMEVTMIDSDTISVTLLDVDR